MFIKLLKRGAFSKPKFGLALALVVIIALGFSVLFYLGSFDFVEDDGEGVNIVVDGVSVFSERFE